MLRGIAAVAAVTVVLGVPAHADPPVPTVHEICALANDCEPCYELQCVHDWADVCLTETTTTEHVCAPTGDDFPWDAVPPNPIYPHP